MNKIRLLEEATVSIDKGYVVIHIEEGSDGIWNIDIQETGRRVRLGVPVDGGTYFQFLDEVHKTVNREKARPPE